MCAWQFLDFHDFRLRRYDSFLSKNDVILDQKTNPYNFRKNKGMIMKLDQNSYIDG